MSFKIYKLQPILLDVIEVTRINFLIYSPIMLKLLHEQYKRILPK